MKQEIGFILRYGRLSLWHRYDRSHPRLGLNTDDFVIISEDRDGWVTRPQPTGGIRLDESSTSKEAVRKLFSQFDPNTCYLTAVVRPEDT